ncbi:MAG TPA: hypothetical protein VLI89_16345 [Burkholderiales bacterium]|nr:hypothetical protein [Burkholderiales bacterium]
MEKELALAASPQRKKLRVGVFADAPLQPRWVVEALAKLAAADFAEVRLIEAGRGAPGAAPLAWRLYDALDRRMFGGAPTDPVLLADQLAPGTPGAPLDIAFALGAVDDARLEGRARYGVWRFCFGADGALGESLAGLAEVASDEPLSASGLKVRLAADRPARLAYQSWSRTYPFSVARNSDQLLRKTAEFAYRAVRELHRAGDGWLGKLRELRERPTPPRTPGVADVTRIMGRLARRGLERALNIEQWFLAYRFGGRMQASLEGYTRIMPPKDRDWADPFVVEKGGRYYVFFEELIYAEGKAHIAMLELDRAGHVSAPQRVLEADHHLSYPYIFEHDGQLWMLPESARNRCVELYRCVDFPLQWKRERVLLEDVRLVDATLHVEKGAAGSRWWMFANSAAGGSRMFDDELHLFYADRLMGDWRPHPRNPVKSDARSSRPAGALFSRNGVLYRPAQVCVPRYGAGLAIQRVLKLTPEEYSERQVERLLPGAESGLFGLHTMNRAGDLIVVDAFARRRRI